MATTTTSTPFVMRLIGALALDPMTYEEVEADRSATGQALLVVVLSSVGAGIGARGLGSGSLANTVFLTALSILAWAAWALLTYQIGVRLMPAPTVRTLKLSVPLMMVVAAFAPLSVKLNGMLRCSG